MSVISYHSKWDLAQKVWDELSQMRGTPLFSSLLTHMKFSQQALDEITPEMASFMDELAERAWKAGFYDALCVMESGAVNIVNPESN